MQRMPHSFIKNGKECKNVAFFWKERMPNPEKKAEAWFKDESMIPQVVFFLIH